MRTVDLLQALAPVLLIPALALSATRRRVIRDLEQRGAVAPDHAVQLDPRSPFARLWVSRLSDAGILRTTGEGASWLDQTAWSEYRRARRRRALAAVGVALAIVLLKLLGRL